MRLLALFVAAGLVGCVGKRAFLLPSDPARPRNEPVQDLRERRDPASGALLAQWEVLVYPDGRTEKHGFERTWFPDGARRVERRFEHDRPTGRWQSWHPTGALRSDYFWHPDGDATRMRFFHADGTPSAEGFAARGIREGHWTARYPNGELREEGPYVGNARQGEWIHYREDGVVLARGRYANGRRVGGWEHERLELTPPEEP